MAAHLLSRRDILAQNPFDQFDAPASTTTSNPFDQFDKVNKPKTGVVRGAGDVALRLGQGALIGTKGIADAFGARNTVSDLAQSGVDKLEEYISPAAKEQAQENAAMMQEAEGKGAIEQIKAAGKSFLNTPLDTVAQGFGTAVPIVAGALGAAAASPALATAAGAGAVTAGLGGAMGAGIAKSSIYDAVEKSYTDAGYGKEDAAKLASEAQSYTGKNTDQIALGAGLGAIAGRTGIEGVLVGNKPTGNLIRRTIGTAAAEGIPEAIQGGQERFASNTALNREGFNVDPMTGVIGQATLEGISGGAMGAATGALAGGGDKLVVDQSGMDADAELAAKKQAEYDAQQQASAAPTDEFTEFVKQADADIERRKVNAGIKKPAEAIPASDILGGENVSTDLSGTTGIVDSGTIANELDNAGGSTTVTSDGVNATGSPINRESAASDIPAGTGSATNDTLNRPFAQATDDFLPKMRSMTTDAKVISQIDEELKLRGLPNVNENVTNVAKEVTPVQDSSSNSSFSGAMAADYLLTGGFGVMESTEYLLQAYSGLSQKSSQAVENIRKKYAQQIIDSKLTEVKDFVKSDLYAQIIGEMESAVSKAHNGNPLVAEIFSDINKYPAGMSPKVGDKISAKINQLELETATSQPNVDSVNTPAERVDGNAKGVHVGEKINKEWTAFSPESGTLNIPRSEMPQVKAEHRGAMVNFLNARGVDHTQETVPASSLKPTQQEFSEAKVKKASKFAGGDRSILVSADNHVLDGHHQWLSKLNKGDNVDVIRLNAPIAQLLDDVKEFPSSTVESGAAEAAKVADPKAVKPLNSKFNRYKSVEREYVEGETSPIAKIKNEVGQFVDSLTDEEYEKLAAMVAKEPYAPEQFKGRFDGIIGVISEPEKLLEQWGSFVKELRKGSTPKSVEPKQAKPKLAKPAKPKTLLATLRDLGGIKLSEKQDVTGEVKGFAPGGYNQVFKQASNRSLKGLIESGDLDDYLPYNMRLESNSANDDAFDSTEAYDYLADKIRNGESVLPYAVVEEAQANQYYQDADATAESDVQEAAELLTEDEINEQLRQATNEERETATEARVINTERENGDTGSGERSAATTQTNASQQAEVDNKSANKTASIKDAEQDKSLLSDSKDNKTDLLGDNTTAKQSVADAERAKDAKRNSGNDNQDTFTLTGSNSEADQAAAAGAQDLFAQPSVSKQGDLLGLSSNDISKINSDIEEARGKLRDIERDILLKAPKSMGAGGGDIESAMRSPLVPKSLKDKRNELRNKIRELNSSKDRLSKPEQLANEGKDEVIHNGVRLYKIKVRNRVEGQPPTEMWAVESTENKARKARGERAIGGDNLSETLDEAKAEAELMLKREADNNQAADAQAKLEAEQKEQSRIDADKKSDIDGFGSELNAMQLGKLKETLNKPTSIKGEVSPLRDAVRKLVAQGGKPEIKEENVYKGMSRAQYNRADNRAQQEDEKRIREGGKKNVYYITMPDGGMFELGKTAHDFAEYLIANKNSDVNETNFGDSIKPAEQTKQALDAIKQDETIPTADKIKLAADLRNGNVTADDVSAIVGNSKPEQKTNVEDLLLLPDGGVASSVLTKESGERVPFSTELISNLTTSKSFFNHLDNLLKVPQDSNTFRDSANTIDSNASSAKGGINSVRIYTEAIRNIIQTKTFLNQGFGGLDAETQRLMLSNVVSLVGNLKVLDSIVKFIPIDVMNYLATKQLTPYMILNDSAMLKSAISKSLNKTVPISVDVSNSFIRAITLAGAEVSTASVVSDLKRPSADGDTTSSTINNNHGNYNTRYDRQNKEIQTKETDSGNVVMFSRSSKVEKIDGKTKVTEYGNVFETGKPVTFNYAHNTFSATKLYGKPNKNSEFNRGYEPSGEYVISIDEFPSEKQNGYEYGTITFNNPLVIANDSLNWKKALSDSFGGLTGKKLSRAIINAGYDGVVTTDGKYTSEILNLQTFNEAKALFSRMDVIDKGLPKEAIQRAVNVLRRNWKNAPEIIVVQDMSDPAIREAVREENDRQLSQGAEGQPEGFFDAGKVYIVASEMNSPDDLIRVVFHETLGHYGLRGLYGKELGGILDRVAMLRKRDMAKKAKQYGLDLTKKSDVRIIAEEVLAEMAQTAPEAGFVKRAIAAIRQFLRDIGVKLELTDDDIIANYLLPARNFVVNGQNMDGVMGLVSAFVRNSREPSKESGDTFLTAALEFTARNEELFDNAPSDSKDIADIAKDMNTQFRVEPFGKSQTKLDGAEKAWEVFMPNYKYRSAVIYEKGNEVWINVARLQSGENQGNEIYSLAAAYAYNNDKVFIGDPLGLTDKAFYRRAENMLSSALKYGTTKHIEPHVAQTDPDLYYSFDEKTKDFGESVRKINWKKGDDAHNIKELIYTVYHGAITNIPELKNVIFNPTTQGFTTIDGEQFTDKDFARVVSDYYARTDSGSGSRNDDGNTRSLGDNEPKKSNPYRAGVRTAKRAALFNTFLREKSGERRSEVLGSYVRELQNRGLADSLKGTFYSRSTSNPSQSSLTPQWDAPAESKLDNVVYALQDKNVDLKRVSQAIKKAGTDIADRWNAYLQEELYHGRTAKRTQDFIKNDLEPLIEDMRMRGVGMADFEEYLWARHAEERNIQIAKINPKMPDGGSGMNTQDARDYLANLSPSNKTKYEALARRIDLINRKSRQVLIDYGLESTATIASWESAYKNYVPLMREDMDAGFGNGTGQGFSVKGNSAKRATGSNRAVVDIIANMAQQYEKNVIRGEKNRVSTALIGLAKLNPNPDFWEVDTPPSTKTIVKGKTIYEVLYNGSKVNEFTNKPAASNFIQWNGSSGYTINEVESPEQVEYVTDPNYKNRDNVIVARIVNKLGKVEERSVVFNQFDERAMRMAASLKNLDQDQIGELLGAASSITRYFASVNTQYNPIFGLINITRDVQGALLNLSTTPIANKKKEVLGNTLDALKGIYQDLRSERKNGTPSGNKWSQLFEEFQNEGGQTGYRDMFRNAKERGESLKNALDPTWWQNSKIGKVISLNGTIANQEQWVFDKAIKPIFDWLSDYNNALENAVRLSVYKVALDNGHSKQQAASMAKNISVNFNRKGEMGRQIGSLYAFFNASVQGTARIGETLTSTDKNGKIKLSTIGKRILQGGLLLGSMQALLLAAAGYDDDEPREFVRDRSIIIPLDFFGADGKFVIVPMPLGYNAIPSFSRILTEWALSGGDKTQERLVHILDMVMNVTNPIGNAGLSLQTIAPTVIDPLAALAENKDSTGRTIAREDMNSLNPTPGFTRAKDTASAISKGLAYGINAITGGTDYKPGEFSPSPDQIDYLIGQVTGGVGREAMKVEQTATALVTGEDLPAYKIPIVGRFYGDATGQSSQGNAFYKNLREINKHENQIKGMLKAGESPAQYKLENPESSLITQANYTERAVQKLRKQRRALLEIGDNPSAIESIDDRITELMLNLNEKVKLRKEMQ